MYPIPTAASIWIITYRCFFTSPFYEEKSKPLFMQLFMQRPNATGSIYEQIDLIAYLTRKKHSQHDHSSETLTALFASHSNDYSHSNDFWPWMQSAGPCAHVCVFDYYWLVSDCGTHAMIQHPLMTIKSWATVEPSCLIQNTRCT